MSQAYSNLYTVRVPYTFSYIIVAEFCLRAHRLINYRIWTSKQNVVTQKNLPVMGLCGRCLSEFVDCRLLDAPAPRFPEVGLVALRVYTKKQNNY